MSETNAIDYAGRFDLMVDEFKRIAACPGANAEIRGLCERAISGVIRRVPIIGERDMLARELAEASHVADSALRQLAKARREREALRAYVGKLSETNAALLSALTALNAKVDELLTAIECAEQDIGHRPIADIIAELGPAYTDGLVALAEPVAEGEGFGK